MADQLILNLFGEALAENDDEIPVDELFQPSGRRRCPHCRRKLAWWGGRLVCTSPYCAGAAS
jgi:hypothetical protein